MLVKAKTVPKRPVADLAKVHNVTPAAIYKAVGDGHIPIVPAGKRKNISEPAFDYHARFG